MKKVIAMSLAMCMTAGMLAGCGNSTTAQSTEEKQEQSSSTAETSEKEEPTEINLMVYAPEDFDPATFPSVKAIEEACNVKLNYEVPPMSSYEEKLQITMASGEYPDLIMFPSHDSQVFKDAVSDGVVVPLNEYLKSADNLNKYISDVSWDCMKVEGEGSVGIVKDFAGNLPVQLKNIQEVNPDAELTYLFVKDKDGEVKGDAYGGGYWFLNAITVAAKGKEQKIVDMLDYLLSDDGWRLLQYGPENVTWHYEGSNIVVDREAYEDLIAPVRNNFTPVRRADDANFFLPVYYDADQADLIESCRKWVQMSIDTAVPSLDSGYVPKAADNPSFIDYNNKLMNTATKVILGNATVDEYKQVLNDWYNNGGTEYVEEMNTWIASK